MIPYWLTEICKIKNGHNEPWRYTALFSLDKKSTTSFSGTSLGELISEIIGECEKRLLDPKRFRYELATKRSGSTNESYKRVEILTETEVDLLIEKLITK